MTVKKSPGKAAVEVRADLDAEREQTPADAPTGAARVTYSYRYIGSAAVVVVVDGQAYDARPGDVVTLPGAVNHPDFVRVRSAK